MTDFDPITAALDLGKAAIERIWPDPAQRAQQIFQLQQLADAKDAATLNAQVQLLVAQIGVNNTEAASKSTFVAGGRPFIIWVGGFALAFTFIVHPMLVWLLTLMKAFEWIPATVVAPSLTDTSPLMALVTALLGVAGMRSIDKFNGVQTDSIKPPK